MPTTANAIRNSSLKKSHSGSDSDSRTRSKRRGKGARKTKNNKKRKVNSMENTGLEVTPSTVVSEAVARLSSRSSSTPRRKKNILENLQCTLSPKYIGFSPPPSSFSGSDETTRSLRRRNLNHSEDITNGIVFSTTPAFLESTISLNNSCCSTTKTTENQSPLHNSLLESESTSCENEYPSNLSENSTTSQENSSYQNEQNTLSKENQVQHASERELKNAGTEDNLNIKNIENIQSIINEKNEESDKILNDDRRSSNTEECIEEPNKCKAREREVIEENALDQLEKQAISVEVCIQTIIKVEKEDPFIVSEPLQEGDLITTQIDYHNEDADNHDDNIDCKAENNSNKFSDMANTNIVVNPATITRIMTEAKSPSTFSTDSARGSSVLNSASWMSFATGDLFWGQIYSYCYWPCMVCPDPEGKTIGTEKNVRNGDQHIVVHVRFFADNGRRNWVKRENLLPYGGLESYKERIREIRNKIGRKRYRLFVPKLNQKYIWLEAIKEANTVSDVLYSERLEKFYELYEESKNQTVKKRRQSMIPHKPSSTSDLGSLNESTDTASSKQKLLTLKRERSVSPTSPAYSPIRSIETKKRKLDISEMDNEVQDLDCSSSTKETTLKAENLPSANNTLESNSSETDIQTISPHADDSFSNIDFRKFYLAMKDFVMESNANEQMEKSLLVAVRNIWALKQISNTQLQRKLFDSFNENDLGSALVEDLRGDGALKRLSNRLKSIMVRRNILNQNNIQSSAGTAIQLTPPVLPALPAPRTTRGNEKPKRAQNRPIDEVIDDIFSLDNKYLFRGLGRDPVCKYCFQAGGVLLRCSKNCKSWLHKDCIGKDHSTKIIRKRSATRSVKLELPIIKSEIISIADDTSTKDGSESVDATSEDTAISAIHNIGESREEIICQECQLDTPPLCRVCNLPDSPTTKLVACSMPQCLKTFHADCCKYWPQAKITKSKNNIESFRCPSHVCHTCVSDDPKGKFQHLSNSKLTKCVKCPATYHTDSTCIPAGSQILTAAYIICPRHATSRSDQQVNVSWCFICVGVQQGQVICCETCPIAVHAKCLNIPLETNEAYICDECESGRMPLYGEIVWAKFNSFRWWPAIILPPTEIPQNIWRKAHNPSDFVVRFFGTHDHGWISRRRVYLYLEGDCSGPPKSRSSLDQSYIRGVEEAKKIYQIVKQKKKEQLQSNRTKEKLHPQPYVRIKTNRAVPPLKLHIDLEKVNKCECNRWDVDPCGPDSNCLNRVLYHECNPKSCPAADKCQNQMFESRVSPRLEVVYMKERGFGLVCREAIETGAFIIEYVGEIINDDEFRQRMAQKSIDRDENFYFLSIEKDYIIDAGPKGNLARFMNHSCDPNCETQKWSVNGLNRVGLFAIKNIEVDTELTFNYHWDDLLGNEKKTCHCGAAKCAGQIGAKYKEEKVKDVEVPSKSSKVKSKTANSKRIAKPKKTLKRLQSKRENNKNKQIDKKSSAQNKKTRSAEQATKSTDDKNAK